MAGIYIHIPFCKQACSYCDFHFSTNLSRKKELISAIVKEAEYRKSFLQGEKVKTIYFGGGTPSLLSGPELSSIFEALHKIFDIENTVEVTLEANPDDLNNVKIKALGSTPVNRLSIGVQSFFEEDLRFMNRAHSANEAKSAIKNAQDNGFNNISIDLIFGSPTTSNKMWEKNLELFFNFKVPHLSAYSLTIEEKTLLAHQINKGKVTPPDDDKNYQQYLFLQKQVGEMGYEQYELSNYSMKGQYSRHNTSYWFGQKYLGLGPSAHSFDGKSRQWNVNNNAKYIKLVSEQREFFEKEVLSEVDRYHELLITRLRTRWGVRFSDIDTHFSNEITSHFSKASKLLDPQKVDRNADGLKVKNEFLFQSDEIVRQLMF